MDTLFDLHGPTDSLFLVSVERMQNNMFLENFFIFSMTAVSNDSFGLVGRSGCSLLVIINSPSI